MLRAYNATYSQNTSPPEHVYNSNLDHLQGVGFLWSFASFPSHKDFLFISTALFHTLFSLSSNERLNWGGMIWNGVVGPSVLNTGKKAVCSSLHSISCRFQSNFLYFSFFQVNLLKSHYIKHHDSSSTLVEVYDNG